MAIDSRDVRADKGPGMLLHSPFSAKLTLPLSAIKRHPIVVPFYVHCLECSLQGEGRLYHLLHMEKNTFNSSQVFFLYVRNSMKASALLGEMSPGQDPHSLQLKQGRLLCYVMIKQR